MVRQAVCTLALCWVLFLQDVLRSTAASRLLQERCEGKDCDKAAAALPLCVPLVKAAFSDAPRVDVAQVGCVGTVQHAWAGCHTAGARLPATAVALNGNGCRHPPQNLSPAGLSNPGHVPLF